MPPRIVRLVASVVFLFVGAFITWLGVSGLLAYVPALGVEGSVTVTYCDYVPRGGVTCTGVFTTPDGEKRTVVVEGADRDDVTVDATVFPWDGERAYARDGAGSALGSVGAAAFGGLVLALGVIGLVKTVPGTAETQASPGRPKRPARWVRRAR